MSERLTDLENWDALHNYVIARLRDAELALAVWDHDRESEYWLRYPEAEEWISAGGDAADPDRNVPASHSDGVVGQPSTPGAASQPSESGGSRTGGGE